MSTIKQKSNKLQNYLETSKKKALYGVIKSHYLERKTQKIEEDRVAKERQKINEVSQFYGREIDELRNKLTEANAMIGNYQRNQEQFKDKMKKALMRGVTAMQLESISAFGNSDDFAQTQVYEPNFNPFDESVKIEPTEAEPTRSVKTNLSRVESSKVQPGVGSKDGQWKNASIVPNSFKQTFMEEEERQLPLKQKTVEPSELYAEMSKSTELKRFEQPKKSGSEELAKFS